MSKIETHRRCRTSRRVSRGPAAGLLLVGLLTTAAGCGDILDVELPTQVPEEALSSPGTAAILVNGVVVDFACAFSEYVMATGLWADEFNNSSGWREASTWGTRVNDYDSGRGTCPVTAFRGGFGVYLPLQIARGQGETAIKVISDFSEGVLPAKPTLLATAAVHAGYATTLLGEAYCEMVLDGGPLITPRETLLVAAEKFTLALAQTSAPAAVLNAARVGRARVRLDLGNMAGAAEDAKLVPANFVYNATYASAIPRRYNTVYYNNNEQLVLTVDLRLRNLTVGGVPDSRVPVKNLNRLGNDALTPSWAQQKYTSVSSPIPMASWREAQLIIAEAEGGQAAVDAINRLRDSAGLPRYGGGTPAEIQAQVREERRRELAFQGHRINDMIRHRIPFDQGLDPKGNTFVNNTCLPLPPAEKDAVSP